MIKAVFHKFSSTIGVMDIPRSMVHIKKLTSIGNGTELGCLKNRILGVFIFPIFGTIDNAEIYFLAKFYF